MTPEEHDVTYDGMLINFANVAIARPNEDGSVYVWVTGQSCEDVPFRISPSHAAYFRQEFSAYLWHQQYLTIPDASRFRRWQDCAYRCDLLGMDGERD